MLKTVVLLNIFVETDAFFLDQFNLFLLNKSKNLFFYHTF